MTTSTAVMTIHSMIGSFRVRLRFAAAWAYGSVEESHPLRRFPRLGTNGGLPVRSSPRWRFCDGQDPMLSGVAIPWRLWADPRAVVSRQGLPYIVAS